MKTVESENEKFVCIWKRLHTEVSLASVVCLNFHFWTDFFSSGVPKTAVGKILFFFLQKSEAPSSLIRLERLTMTHKIPRLTKVRSRRRANLWLPRAATGLTDKSAYCHQASFLLGRPWLLLAKCRHLFSEQSQHEWQGHKSTSEDAIFLWFNIKVTPEKNLRIYFLNTTSDFFKTSVCVLFGFDHSFKEEGLLDIHRTQCIQQNFYMLMFGRNNAML